LHAVSARLGKEAHRIGARSTRLEMLNVLSELGLGLRIAPPRDKHHRGDLRRTPSGWEITIARSNGVESEQGLSSQERYTIAHEIGHYLVEAWFPFRPTSGTEYWALEEVCDDFADRVLVPDQVLNPSTGAQSAVDLADNLRGIARRVGAPLKAAARRLIACIDGPAAVVSLRLDPLDSSGRLGWVEWVAENRPWLGRQRCAFYMSGPLAAALRPEDANDVDLPGCAQIALSPLARHRTLLAALIKADAPPFVGRAALASH
jgi:hypothetical protein